MTKKLISLGIAVAFSLGAFGIIMIPFTNTDSPLYSDTAKTIDTEILFTVENAYAGCEDDWCKRGRNCTDGFPDHLCNMSGDGCYTDDCNGEFD